ncbi:MAG TPA: hypothetical protein VHV30_11680 [Polyangiaceae bacterium]|jgi:hypothetical protein|nr:hypothetical protein [Polyangiaceae bacterium]
MSQPRDVVARNCPTCGAQLEPSPPGRIIVCRYCGHSFQPPPEVNPAPRIIVLQPGMTPPGTPPPRANAGRALATLASTMVFALGVVIFALRSRGTSMVMPTATEVSSAIAGLTPSPPSSWMWDTVAGPPIAATVGAGGFVGRLRARGDDELYVAAFDDAKLAQLWKAGPLGTYSEGYRSTFTEVVGHKVVVTDFRANLHVYDLGTGRETKTLKLTDRASETCASPDGKDHVWIGVSDEKNVLLDADAGTLTPSPRPAWCTSRSSFSGTDCRGWLTRGDPRPGCKSAEVVPRVSGFDAENAIEDGDLAVALGKKHPGTATPMVVGFDPKTKAVRWQSPLASGDQAIVKEPGTEVMDAMTAGRFVAPYSRTKGIFITAFDARSGQRLWDVPLQPVIGSDDPEGFSLSATRVYVTRTSSLEVYDAKTGALVGTLGD